MAKTFFLILRKKSRLLVLVFLFNSQVFMYCSEHLQTEQKASTVVVANSRDKAQAQFFGKIEEISEEIAALMTGRSWIPVCPVQLKDLRYLTVAHWGYDNTVHTGHVVVHVKLAQEMLEIFEELFQARFPIERMELIDLYEANDERSMEANNSSAFCCRANTTKPGVFSNHSYGIAIDINPLINPYVRGSLVLPNSGKVYVDRTQSYVGMITETLDNPCYRAFVTRGYEWGGNAWPDRIDYQHFSKQISDIS